MVERGMDMSGRYENGIVVTEEQVNELQSQLHYIMHIRYSNLASDERGEFDEYWRGCQNGLEYVLDLLGIEHEQWNPLGYLMFGKEA